MLLSSLSRRCSTSMAAPLYLQYTRCLVQRFTLRSPTPQTVESKFPQAPPSLQLRLSHSPPTFSRPPRRTRSFSAMSNFANVLRELQVDALPDSTTHKRPLV